MTAGKAPAHSSPAQASLRVDARFAGWLFALLVVAAYFRVAAIENTVVEEPLIADARDYYLSAYNLAHRGVYSRATASVADPNAPVVPDSFRAPGMPLVIAPFMGAWPDHMRIIERVQRLDVVLGVAAVAAVFVAASAVLPRPAAVAVGLLAAASPHMISLTVYVLSETPASLFVALLLASTAIGVPAKPNRRMAFFLVQGALVGALSLFRPAFLAFAPVLALAYVERADRRAALVYGCLGAFLVVAPWFVRNAVSVPAGEAPSLLASTLLEASYRGYIYAGDPSTFPYGARADPQYYSLRTSVGATLTEILHKVAANPASYLAWYFARKAVYLFQWSNIDGEGDVFVYAVSATPFASNPLFIAVHRVYRTAHPVLLALGAIGAVATWSAKLTSGVPAVPVLRMASLLLAFVYLVHVPFPTCSRFLVPVLPALYLSAVFSVVAGARAWRRRAQ